MSSLDGRVMPAPKRGLVNAGQERQLLVAYSAGPYGAALADGSEYDGSYADRVSEEQIVNFHAKRLHVSILSSSHQCLWTCLAELGNRTMPQDNSSATLEACKASSVPEWNDMEIKVSLTFHFIKPKVDNAAGSGWRGWRGGSRCDSI